MFLEPDKQLHLQAPLQTCDGKIIYDEIKEVWVKGREEREPLKAEAL